MTKIKLCGLSRVCDIQAANRLRPEYIGFVFAAKSKRCVTPQKAADLKAMLDPAIQAVGVFVDEAPETVAGLLNSGTIDICQLHGREDEAYIRRLRQLTDRPIIRAFRIGSEQDIPAVQSSTADYVLLDSGPVRERCLTGIWRRRYTAPISLPEGLESTMWKRRCSGLHPSPWTSARALKQMEQKTK